MSTILSNLDGVLYLMDDVLVFGKDEGEHHHRLITTLQKIQSSGITLNPEKCVFAARRVKSIFGDDEPIRKIFQKLDAAVKTTSRFTEQGGCMDVGSKPGRIFHKAQGRDEH